MRKQYVSPEVEVERFFLADVLTSSGIGAGDGVIDTLDDTDEPQG